MAALCHSHCSFPHNIPICSNASEERSCECRQSRSVSALMPQVGGFPSVKQLLYTDRRGWRRNKAAYHGHCFDNGREEALSCWLVGLLDGAWLPERDVQKVRRRPPIFALFLRIFPSAPLDIGALLMYSFNWLLLLLFSVYLASRSSDIQSGYWSLHSSCCADHDRLYVTTTTT